jgi:hypothetical protein
MKKQMLPFLLVIDIFTFPVSLQVTRRFFNLPKFLLFPGSHCSKKRGGFKGKLKKYPMSNIKCSMLNQPAAAN